MEEKVKNQPVRRTADAVGGRCPTSRVLSFFLDCGKMGGESTLRGRLLDEEVQIRRGETGTKINSSCSEERKSQKPKKKPLAASGGVVRKGKFLNGFLHLEWESSCSTESRRGKR